MLLRALGATAAAVTLAIGGVVLLSAASFTDTFDGTPPNPIPFHSANWELSVATTNWAYNDEIGEPNPLAQHGPGCEAPGQFGTVTHTVSRFDELVYQCRDHVMTHLPDDQYATLYMTPNQLIDLSGAATLRFDISTLALSTRDWIDVLIQDWNTQEQAALDDQAPIQQGNPRNTIQILMTGAQGSGFSQDEGNRTFMARYFDASRNVAVELPGNWEGWRAVLPELSAQARVTIQVDMNPGHIKVWMPQSGFVFVDGAFPTPAFTQGVVSFGHHSYSPGKGFGPAEGGGIAEGKATTWHWDNLGFEPAIPITITHSDHRAAQDEGSVAERTFTFERPTPAQSVMRFTAHGTDIHVSFDGGPFVPATPSGVDRGGPVSYLMPVPAGVTRATFEVRSPTYGFVGAVVNPTVFSLDGGAPSPTPSPSSSPTGTSTPTPTASPSPSPSETASPTPTPSASPSPSPTPSPAFNARCTVRDRNDANSGWREVEGVWVPLSLDVWTCGVTSIGRAP